MSDDLELHYEITVQRWSPYAVDGGCDAYAYGQMEEDDLGGWVSFEEHTYRIEAMTAAVARLTVTVEASGAVLGAAAELSRGLRRRAEAAETKVGQLRAAYAAGNRNRRETFNAMVAMRNTINDYVALPSLESDLLQGPEDSVFFAAVAKSVVQEIDGQRHATSALFEELKNAVDNSSDADWRNCAAETLNACSQWTR